MKAGGGEVLEEEGVHRVGINQPEGAAWIEVFTEWAEALELLVGFNGKEDEIRLVGSAVLGGIEDLGKDRCEKGRVPNPE